MTEVLRASAAMAIAHSPVAIAILKSLSAGRILVTFRPDEEVGYIEGSDVPNVRSMGMCEVMWIFRAGYIDKFGVVTGGGRTALKGFEDAV